MADSGGHWNTLAAAQKLTQSMKIPGVFEEDIKRNNPIERVAVAQAAHSGKKIEWLREQSTTMSTLEAAVAEVDIGEQLAWTEDVDYDEKEAELKRSYVQRKLDHFVEGIYGTYNNYEARMLLECEKAIKRKIGARLIYADDYTSGQFNGLHAWARETSGDLNIDNGEVGLSLANLRTMVDAMKHGCDELWMPFEIVRRMDAAYQERGFLYTVSGTTQVHKYLGFLTLGYNELGKRVLFWDAIPIIRTDFLVAENQNVGLTSTSSNVRTLYTANDKQYSVFGVKHGNVLDMVPGVTYAYGGTEGFGDFYKLVRFPELENYDAGGIRLVNYGAVLLGSSLCLGRIADIEDVAITV
jgi:hypothetical protein